MAKPAGPTSHDVVDVARRVLGVRRVGHLGTLDPFAEGLLVLVVGRATRLAPFAARWRKRYEGVIRLGETTDTDDRTGRRTGSSPVWRELDVAAVTAALDRFCGTFSQRPPAHSAVKVAGERAYRRARRGEAVAPAPREVRVDQLELVELALPDVRFRATVSAGTYLRSIARDLGESLGCGAHLAALRRTAVGPFDLTEAVTPNEVTVDRLRDPGVLVSELPRHMLTPEEREAAAHGRPIHVERATLERGTDQPVALFAGEELIAVAEVADDMLKPRVVVAEP